MSLPWMNKNDVNLATNEFVNQYTMNRNLDHLLENDIYLEGLIDSGIATELATDAEAISGVITTKAVTPSQLQYGMGLVPYFHVRQEEPSGTNGNDFVVGWNYRDLNAVNTNTIGAEAFISANKVTLPAGTYYIKANVTGVQVGSSHATQLELYNSDTTSTMLYGMCTTDHAGYGVPSPTLTGRFTIEVATEFSLRQWSDYTVVITDGQGLASNSGNPEVYADVEFWKLS